MKKTYLTPILSAVLLTATAITAPSCINDLDISSIDPQSSSSFDQQGTFVKQYALLGLTGQKGLAGTPDLDGQELYNYIAQELEASEDDLYEPGQAPFGRADKAANWLLHARLCLNAEVYTGTPDWENARAYANKVIQSGAYELCNDYRLMFMADNDQNPDAMKEIIFPIRQDGMKTRNYGGATYLICGTRTGGMPHMGTTNGWSCLVARKALIDKFFPEGNVPMIPENVQIPGQEEFADDEAIDAWDEQYGVRTIDLIAAAGDDRAMFYSGAGGGRRTLFPEAITGFQSGLSIVKWQNIRSDGAATSHTEYPDTDIPLLRLAEAYLTRAEASYRLNDTESAWQDICTLRNSRQCSVMPAPGEITEDYLIDEWAREFYLEGRRRSDLVRFGRFTSGTYLWDWKGGTREGKAVSEIYNRFPIPDTDLNNNPNLTQNEGY